MFDQSVHRHHSAFQMSFSLSVQLYHQIPPHPLKDLCITRACWAAAGDLGLHDTMALNKESLQSSRSRCFRSQATQSPRSSHAVNFFLTCSDFSSHTTRHQNKVTSGVVTLSFQAAFPTIIHTIAPSIMCTTEHVFHTPCHHWGPDRIVDFCAIAYAHSDKLSRRPSSCHCTERLGMNNSSERCPDCKSLAKMWDGAWRPFRSISDEGWVVILGRKSSSEGRRSAGSSQYVWEYLIRCD